MLPNGGNSPPLSMADINGSSGFSGRGNNLNAYRGTLFYRPDNSSGYFSAGAINISDFYATQGTSPVVPGNATYTSGSSITLPALFNKLYVRCYGAGGGGGGGCYVPNYNEAYGGSSGGAGGSTTFWAGSGFAVTGQGGGAGGGAGLTITNALGGVVQDGNGSSGSGGSGGSGGSAGGGGSRAGGVHSNGAAYPYTLYRQGGDGGSGGVGGNSGEILVMDIDSMGWATIKNYYGISVPISIGAAGGGGSGGAKLGSGAAGNGGSGSGGWIYLRWT